jgi:hypothetical protein
MRRCGRERGGTRRAAAGPWSAGCAARRRPPLLRRGPGRRRRRRRCAARLVALPDEALAVPAHALQRAGGAAAGRPRRGRRRRAGRCRRNTSAPGAALREALCDGSQRRGGVGARQRQKGRVQQRLQRRVQLAGHAEGPVAPLAPSAAPCTAWRRSLEPSGARAETTVQQRPAGRNCVMFGIGGLGGRTRSRDESHGGPPELAERVTREALAGCAHAAAERCRSATHTCPAFAWRPRGCIWRCAGSRVVNAANVESSGGSKSGESQRVCRMWADAFYG